MAILKKRVEPTFNEAKTKVTGTLITYHLMGILIYKKTFVNPGDDYGMQVKF